MYPWRLRQLNIFLVIVALLLFAGTATLLLYHEETPLPPAPPPFTIDHAKLPTSFKLNETHYSTVGKSFLHLQEQSIPLKLPDLRPLLISYGILQRPDAPTGKKQLLLGIRGVATPGCFYVGEKIYLKYDSKAPIYRWSFNDNNSPTSIWVETDYYDKKVILWVKMCDHNNTIIEEPKEFTYFVATEMPLPIATNDQANSWIIGQERVTLHS